MISTRRKDGDRGKEKETKASETGNHAVGPVQQKVDQSAPGEFMPLPVMLERQSDLSGSQPGAFSIVPGGPTGERRMSSVSYSPRIEDWESSDGETTTSDEDLEMPEARQPLDDSELVRAWPINTQAGTTFIAMPHQTALKAHEESSTDEKGASGTRGLVILLAGFVAFAALASFITILVVFPARDPDRVKHTRTRQTIVDAFGEDYFDNPQKNKALHWIVYQDPRNHLGVKEKGHHNDLIQRFLLVSFYFQTSYQQPWASCNPPVGKQSDTCFYKVFYADAKYHPPQDNIGTRWLTATHECEWMGVSCAGGARKVTQMDIYKNNLQGSIPDGDVAMLTHLNYLALQANNMMGSFPMRLFDSTALQSIDLKFNALTGKIPPQAFLMPNLKYLYLGDNQFTGSIPNEIGAFSGSTLDLQGNLLTGSIPDNTYKLSSLKNLWLPENLLTGSLSSSIGSMASLRSLALGGNRIGGSIPSEIGLLELLELEASKTRIRGTIPEQVYSNQQLKRLALSGTQLSGTIRTRVGLLKGLEEFEMADTKLVGTVPDDLASLPKLRQILLNGNPDLYGSIPDELCSQLHQRCRIVADCTPVSSKGNATMFCPKGCCSTCCDARTNICLDP